MSAYVYLWDIFVCAFHGILSIPAFWLRSIRVCFNLIGIFIFLFVFRDAENAVADTPPHALGSAGPIRVSVGALCWWDMKHGPHIPFRLCSLSYSQQAIFFRFLFWACNHVVWTFHQVSWENLLSPLC